MRMLYTGFVFVVLLLSVATGWVAQPRLRERHVTRESVESVRLLMGMLLTRGPANRPRRATTPASTSEADGGVEGASLGDMLAGVDDGIERLAPPDEFHREVAGRLRDRVVQVVQQRWQLIFSARSTLSWPFLLILTAWLSIIYGIFGLTAPRNGLIYAVVLLSALSMASPLYLILGYSGAQTGLLQLSSEPMLAALSHMDR